MDIAHVLVAAEAAQTPKQRVTQRSSALLDACILARDAHSEALSQSFN